ncbi:MAG: GGDEF domain-containing protein [Dokdonella sp.]|uniref:GGDEF domain-containing protein n=1 Tax=Dokdonella sp. TaxID=2291710 RepID=UPI003264DC6F
MNVLDISLDVPTLTLSRALIQAILAGLLLYVGSGRKGDDATHFWALGLFLNGVALILFLTPNQPEWEHLLTLSNHSAITASSVCLLMGFWRFAAQPFNRWLLALLIVIPIVGLLSFDVLWPNTRLRILLTAFGQAIYLFALQQSLRHHPRPEIASIYRRLRVIVIVYLLVFTWSYATVSKLLPASAEMAESYHRAFFSLASLLFMLALAVGCLALQFALLAARESDHALTDWLTGLRNRRGFFRALDDIQQRTRTLATGSSVVAIDVDHFKALNDRYGHGGGDHALTKLADVLRDRTTPEHLVARMGGEEFCVVLPGSDSHAALVLAESIREACGRMALHTTQGERFSFTISAGICDVPPGGSFDEALIRADEAMYVAKRLGRNRTETAGSRPDVIATEA